MHYSITPIFHCSNTPKIRVRQVNIRPEGKQQARHRAQKHIIRLPNNYASDGMSKAKPTGISTKTRSFEEKL